MCAVTVTFHPSARMVQHLQKVLPQVQKMVIVDNGSRNEERVMLREAAEASGFQLIENAENLGIAEALNQGVRFAKEHGYSWVLLLDQDSCLNEGFVERMVETWAAHPQKHRVAAIHPRYVDPKTGLQSPVRRADDGGPITSMTSGALMPIWVFDKIGEFASEYFIDCVDTEYCFRIRAAGYLLVDSAQAELTHATGNSELCRILGFSFRPTHHSTVRRYYMSRNRIMVFRKYLSIFPRWALVSMYDSLRDTVKCLLGEPNRSIKLRRIVLGTWDGLTGRMGKRENL